MATKVSLTLESNICGICEEPEGSVTWLNHASNYAHPECIKKIHAIDRLILDEIKKYFTKSQAIYIEGARREAMTIIKKQIGDLSILAYREKFGSDALKKIAVSDDVCTAIQNYYNYTHKTPKFMSLSSK